MKNITIKTLNGSMTIDYFVHAQSIMNMHATLQRAAMEYYPKTGLSFAAVPYIVGITGACENVNTLFKIGNKLNVPAFFNQTGQLALECFQMFAPGVFTIIHSGRDEGQEDKRHLLEFNLTEEEFSWPLVEPDKPFDQAKMFEYLLERIERAVKYMAMQVVKKNRNHLEKYGRNVDELDDLLTYPFLQVTYTEAVTLLQQNGYPNLEWCDDLKAEHEQTVVRVANESARERYGPSYLGDRPVFITRYPKEIKFFNMMQCDDDPLVVWSADLILPIAGESVGSAVREPNPKRLKQRLLESNMFRIHKESGGTYDDFTWYIEEVVGSGKIQPHAGYGLGNERLIQWLTGFPDIRDCAPFSLHAKLTGDFDERRRGTGLIVSPPPRAILLSIADNTKEELLPSIRVIANNGLAFYATKGTHEFLAQNGIATTLVYKLSDDGDPNINTLFANRVVSTVVNIPSRQNEQEETDGQKIRKLAVSTGTSLITEEESANYLFASLANKGK